MAEPTNPWALRGSWDEWAAASTLTCTSATSGYAEVALAANQDYEFKFVGNGSWYGATTVTKIIYSNKGTAQTMNNTSGSNQTIRTASAGTYRFTWDITNKKVTVTYPTSYTVTFSATTISGTNGQSAAPTATYNSGAVSVTSGDYVPSATSVTFTAAAAKTGYTFNGWYTASTGGTQKSSALSYSETVSSDITRYARYTQNTYSVTLTNESSTYGTVNTSSPVTVGQAEAVQIKATAKTGYKFKAWVKTTGTGTVSYWTAAGTAGSTDASGANKATTYIKTTGTATLQATYEEDLTSTWHLVGNSTDFPDLWNVNATTMMQKQTGLSTESVVYMSVNVTSTTQQEFKVVDDAGASADIWYGYSNGSTYLIWEDTDTKTVYAKDDGGDNNNGNNLKFTPTVVGTYTFKVDYSGTYPEVTITYPTSYTVNYGVSPSGAANAVTTSPSVTSGGRVLTGTSVTFTHQVAKTGYIWSGWYNNAEGTGTALGTGNTYTASITQNTDVYAVYTENEYNVTVSAGTGGTVSPSGTVAVKQISGTQITATPNLGYAFNNWTKSGNNITLTSTTTNSTTAKATSAGGSVTANFVEDWYICGDNAVMGSWETAWASGKLTADGANFSITLNLEASTTYEFKLYKRSGDNHWWSNSTDISGKTTSASNVALYYDDGNNMSITTTIAGEYKFTLSDVSSANPKLSIDFPSALMIFRSTPTHSEVIATHAWDSNTGGSVYRKTLALNGNTTYEFKIYDGGEYYTHGTKITTSISNRNFSNSGSDCQLETKSAGSFIFDWDRSSKALTVHYPQSAIVEATPDKVYSGSTVTFTGYASELGSGSHTVKYEFFKGTTLTAVNKVAELTKTETATHQQVTTDPITVTFDGNTTSQVYTLRVTSDGVVRGTNTCTVYRKWDIYVHDVDSWNAMYYYVYNADGSHRDLWPGYDYSAIKYNGNDTWYSVALDAQYPYFILDNNAGNKQLIGDQQYETDITTYTPGSFWYVDYNQTYTSGMNDGKSYYDLTQINLTDPTVTLETPEVISGTMAYFTGIVTNFGNDGMSAAEMREVGVYIGETKYTTTCYGTGDNSAKFYIVVDGLTAGTTYSARAFALNAHGEGKSAAQSFTTRAHSTYTIKVRASSTPYIYAWSYKADPNSCGEKTEQNHAWPGIAMTSTGVTGAQGTWYEYTMDNTYNQFKVTTGANAEAYTANQTGDWTAPGEDKCYWYWNGTEKASHGNQTMGEMTCPYLTPQLMIETTAGGGEYVYHEMTGTGTVSYSITLVAETTYKFKIVNNSDWYTNNTKTVYPEDCSNISFRVIDGSGNECQIGTTYSGTYTFIYNTLANTLSVTYPTLPNVIGTVGLGATGYLSGSGTSAKPYIIFAGKTLTLLTTHSSAPAADSHFKYTYYKGDSELATKLSTAADAKQYALEVGSVAGTYTAKVSAYYEYGLAGHTAKGTAKEATVYYKVIDIPTPTLTLSPTTKVQLGNAVTLTGSVTNETGVAVSSTAWSFFTGTASGSVTTAVSTNSTSPKTHTPTAVGTQYYKAVLNMWGETMTSAEQQITVYVPITVQSNNDTYGTITSATSIEYSSGNATIQATKKTGYKFSVWQATEGITIANPKSRNTTFTATQAGTITAVFIPDYGSRWFIRGTTDHNLSDDATALSWSTDLDEINDDKYELTKESYDGNIAYAYLNFNHDAATGQSVTIKLYNPEASAGNMWRGNNTSIVRTATLDYPVNNDVGGNTTIAVTVPGTYTFALDLTTYKLTITYPEVNFVRGSWDAFAFSNEMTAGTGDESHIYSWSIDASSLSAFTDYTFFIVNDGNQLFSPQTGVSINHNNNKVGLLACDTTSYHFGFKTTTADVSTTTGTRGKYVFHYNTVTKQVTIDYPDLKTPKDITITVKAIQAGTDWWDAVGFHIWGTNGGDDDGDYPALWVTDKTEGGVNYKYFYYTFHTNGSINFTINKWNKSGSSIYLDGTNQTGDITNVTADHCYTILQSPTNDYGGHKGYHTDEGSCVPLLYKVKTTLTDGTVYYSNEGTQNGDTLSFYATTTTVNAAKYKRNGTTVLQKMTSSGWQTLQTLNTTQIKESNVYYGILSTSDGNLTNITKYEGDYYVLSPTTTVAQDFRTDAWGSDEKSNAVMTYFPPSENYVDTYRYYHVNWLEGNTVKLKGQVANEYNANLAQYEDIQEPYTTADGKSADEKGVNLRFSYDPETNVFKRTFLAGASDRPNFLTMYDDSLNLKMLNKTDLITKEEPIRYSDGTNWLYMVDSYATIETNKATPHVVLVANFNEQDQYLFEKDEKGIPYNRRLYQKNMTTPGTYKTRVIYDYKTNRIISAWLIDTDTQISSDINLYDNVLFRRINNDPIKNMDIAAANKVAQVNMIYTELEIQRGNSSDDIGTWMNLFSTSDNKSDGVARYGFYWFSLPYECYIEDIMGLGGKYGEKWYILRYRGDKRAQSGWYLDNSTFWERLSPHGLMKPGEGYVVAVNLAVTDFKEVKVHSSKWVEGQAPDSTVASLRIFFPSDFYYVHTEVKDTNSIYQTVPVHECNIPARRIYDSNWNVIGIPSLEPLTFSSATGDYVYDNETNTAGNPTFVYEWSWNKVAAAAGNYGSGNSFTYTLKSAAGMTFLPTFSYMTQYAGTITWNKNYSSVSQWGSSYGAPQKHNEQKPYRRMELSLRNTDSDELDNTFVYLQDGATDDYDLNLDIVKIFNDGVTNFYSLGAYYETTDQNGNPMTDHVEFGGNVLPVKNTVVPLGIRAERQETMTITLSNKEMITGVVPVLYDKEQDRYTNLLTADYTFSLDRLTLEDRLFLNLYLSEEDIPDGILTDNAVANNDEQYSITAVDGGIIINGINGTAFVRMYDPTGRLMFSGQVEQGQLLNVPVQQAFILNVDGTVVKAVRK